MLPLARPGLIIIGIFNEIGLWNEYGLALVLINSEANKTLPLGLANLVMTEHYQSDWGALFAALVIVMLPVMIVYWIFWDRLLQPCLQAPLTRARGPRRGSRWYGEQKARPSLSSNPTIDKTREVLAKMLAVFTAFSSSGCPISACLACHRR